MSMGRFTAPRFSLRQVQYAVAVAETGGFGRAAELCAVSQPSLSAQVAKLEGVLGVQLFERHARGVLVTAAGEAMLPRLRAMIDRAVELDQAAAALVDPFAATLRVGVIPTIAPYLVPLLVDRLRESERPVRVHWLELQTARCEAELGSGALDAMILADPPTMPSVDAIEIGFEPFHVMVPTDHALVGPVTPVDLVAHPLLLLEDGHCLRDHTMSLCMQPGSAESPYRATSLPTLVQMVASGLGITVVPRSAIAIEASRAHVRTVDFASGAIGRTVYMGWRSRSPYTRVLRELAGAVRASLADATA